MEHGPGSLWSRSVECFRQAIWLLKGRNHCGEIYLGGRTKVLRSHKVREWKGNKARPWQGSVQRGARKAHRLG